MNYSKKMLQIKYNSVLGKMVITSLLLTSISAQNSLWPSGHKLTLEEKICCIQFQNLRGSSRLDEFKRFCVIVFGTTAKTAKEKTLVTTNYNMFEIEKMLGKPNDITENNTWVYNLNTTKESCKAFIRYDKETQSVYCNVADCK